MSRLNPRIVPLLVALLITILSVTPATAQWDDQPPYPLSLADTGHQLGDYQGIWGVYAEPRSTMLLIIIAPSPKPNNLSSALNPVDTHLAVLGALHHSVTPGQGHDILQGDVFGFQVIFTLAVGIFLDKSQHPRQGTIDFAVGARGQCFKQGRHHAPVMAGIGLACFQLNLLLVGTLRLIFGHNLLQRFFAGHRIDNFADDAIGLGNGDLGWRPDHLFQTTIALKDIRASGTNKIDLGDLSAEDANQRIQELYTFLGGDVTIEVQGGTVTVQADVESELNRQGQRLFDKAIAEANRGRYSAAIRLLEQVLEQAPASGGRLIFHIFGALAEFERNLIRERTMVGLEAARARGRVGGRRKALDEFPRRLQDVRNESRQLVHQNELYWVFSLNKEIDDLVTHLYASKEMVRKYDHLRAQNKITNDELTCLQDENGEVRRRMRLLREKMTAAMENGQGVFRGLAKDATALGNEINTSTISTIMSKNSPQLAGRKGECKVDRIESS